MSEEPEDGLEPISEGGLDENTDPDMNARDPLRQSQEIFHSLGHEDQIAATGEMDSVSIGSVNPMWQETPLGDNEQDAELPFLPAPDSDAAYSFDFDEAQLRETYPSLDMEPIPEDTQLAILTPSTEPETPIFEDTDEEKASLQEIDLSLDQDIEEALASFDLQGMEPLEEEELDVDDILEFDDLSGYIQEVEDDEYEEAHAAPQVDPFLASGMYVMGEEEDAARDDLSDTMGADDSEVVLDPLSMSGFEVIEEIPQGGAHEPLYPDEEVVDEEIIFIDSGIYEIDEDLDDEEAMVVARRFVIEDTDPEAQAEEPRVERQLRVGLDAMGARFSLREPWSKWATELRLEVLQEPDIRKRGAYIYLFSTMLRLHGEAGAASASQLESAAKDALEHLRGPRILQLAEAWNGSIAQFVERLDQLRAHDEQSGVEDVEERHASIVVARIIEELLRGKPPAQLLERIDQDQTIGALVIQALFAHRRGDRVAAAGFWRQLARYVQGDEREHLLTLSGYLTKEYSSFFERAAADSSPASMSRILLTSMQYGACWNGDHLLEAQALEWSLDQKQDDEEAAMAATLHRLAMLRGAMEKGGEEGSLGLALEAAMAASRARPDELIHWLAVERLARRVGDMDALIESFQAQIRLIDDATIRALVREQFAHTLILFEGEDGEQEARQQLERALQDSGDCLPVLLTLGQARVRNEDWDGVMRLRSAPSVGESQAINPAWRRADLLERIGGDPREVLALYRSARHEHPESVHLFMSIERSLARLGQWRGLVNLFDGTLREQPEFAARLEENGIELAASRLAVESYLEEVHRPSLESLEQYAERHGVIETTMDEHGAHIDPPRVLDEPILWKLVAARVHRKQWEEVEELLELVVASGRSRGLPELEARGQLWMIYLLGIKLRQPRRCKPALRRLFEVAASPTLRRFAFHGMLRLGDEAWLAQQILDQPEQLDSLLDALRTHEDAREGIAPMLAAELFARAGESTRASKMLRDCPAEDEATRVYLSQRSLTCALRARDWGLVHELLAARELNQGIHATPIRHQLNVCQDNPAIPEDVEPEILEILGADPLHAISLLEAAIRTNSWEFARGMTISITRAFAPSHAPIASFARVLTVIISEWLLKDHEGTLRHVRDWSDMGGEGGGELGVLLMLSAWYRAARRLGREVDSDTIAETIRDLFNDATVALFEQELPLNKRPPEEVAAWYRSRADHATGTTRVYLRVSGALIPWLLGRRDRNAAADIADAVGLADDVLHLMTFFGVLSHREIAQHASAERYLGALAQQRDVLGLAQWAGVRALFHLATTQNCPEDAVRQLREASVDAAEAAPWLADFGGLLVRALRRPDALGPLEVLERQSEGAARAAQLEIAELTNDHETITNLANSQLPAAMILAEVRAANERKDWRQRSNLELRYAGLRQSLVNDSQDIIRLRFLDFISEIEPAIFGSPWGPMRLIDDDLGRLGLPSKALDTLCETLGEEPSTGMMSVLRLGIAQQLLRLGRVDRARELFPSELGVDLISRAWFWFGYLLLDPHEEGAQVTPEGVALQRRFMELWRARARRASGETRAEILYEVARLAEVSNDEQIARDLYEEILDLHPAFTPAEIACSRLLLLDGDWKGVAAIWERSLARTESEIEQIGISFRLGFIYERRLSHLPNALQRALDHYARVASLRSSSAAALHAMVRIAQQLGRYDLVADSISSLIPLCLDRDLKASFHLELAALYEQELGAPQEALRHYLDAHFLDPHSHVSLYGTLRTDADGEREHAVEALSERLDVATAREAEELGDLLFLLGETSPRAEYLMRQRFGEHLVWRLVQFVDGIERGEVHEEALLVTVGAVMEPQLKEIFIAIERAHTSSRQPMLARDDLARDIGTRPTSEGMLVSTIARAWRERDMESLAQLAYLQARRARGSLEVGTEMTRAAMMIRWLGTIEDSLDLCERALERSHDFLPAVKLARLLASEIPNWPAVARWCAREADLTRVSSIALRARVEASEVQRRHIGDLDAAIDQLEIVVANEPHHSEAFENLKTLLIQAHRIPEALEMCEQRLTQIKDRNVRLAQLNEMADLALSHGQMPEAAIRYLAASISIEPRQLRRLRILAELYDAQSQYQQALACYDAATRISRDERLNARMLLQMGHILELKLGEFEPAARAYARVVELDPDNAQALQALVRVRRNRGDFRGAMEGLARMERLARSPEELRKVRTLRLEVAEQGNLPTDVILSAACDLMVYHPTQLQAADIFRERLMSANRAEELDLRFRQLLDASLREHTTPPLGAYFALARRLGLDDLSYMIAASGRWLRMASRDMLSFHDSARQTYRWPREPIPLELTTGVLPQTLSVAFFEIIRRTQEGLLEACEPIPYSQFIKRRSRLQQPTSPAQELAWRWPKLFGLELRDVYSVSQLPMGSAIVWDDGVRLLLDRSWDKQEDAYKLLVRLGIQMAAWSMGIGYWSALGREAQVSLFAETVASVSPSWSPPPRPKFPSWFSREKWKRWMQRTGSDRVAPYALELASRMGPRALPSQFLSLELAMERLACVILPDPAQYLNHTVRFGVENGPEHRPWTFVFDPSVASLRRALEISL